MVKDFNILIIEDELKLAENLKKTIIDNFRYKVDIDIVTSGEMGLKRLVENMPDFIFLNQYMPGITGLEMLERCKSLNLKLPTVIVVTGGISTREHNRFLQLGVKSVLNRLMTEGTIDYLMDLLEWEYESSLNIPDEEMMKLIEKQTRPILKNLDKSRTPYQVSLIGFILKYLIEQKLEYSKENKTAIYEYFRDKDNLEEQIIKEIQTTIESVIEENYAQGNPIKKLNYGINKDEIQEKFFHILKENVIKDIIAESN